MMATGSLLTTEFQCHWMNMTYFNINFSSALSSTWKQLYGALQLHLQLHPTHTPIPATTKVVEHTGDDNIIQCPFSSCGRWNNAHETMEGYYGEENLHVVHTVPT
jgi:hypothetical protein